MFNSRFRLVHLPGKFRDRALPAGFAPFGIQDVDGFIYVTYALQNAAKHDDVAGAGNFGDGLIHAYGLFSGQPFGPLRDEHGQPIQIDDLWALKAGTAMTGGTHTVLFSAGINDEKEGLVGSINRAR